MMPREASLRTVDLIPPESAPMFTSGPSTQSPLPPRAILCTLDGYRLSLGPFGIEALDADGQPPQGWTPRQALANLYPPACGHRATRGLVIDFYSAGLFCLPCAEARLQDTSHD
jgi:hypothetical protein